MNNYSIRVSNLGKIFSYKLKDSLKYGMKDSISRVFNTNANSNNRTLRKGEFHALENINFELMPGECMGIMGSNGSGKTTLLRILNGVFRPDYGEARLRGRIGALIAAGAGFSPLLTGRENIFVNGTLLGMSHKEIASKLDEIVHFSDLDGFIDMPVRNYSSGMSVRLGFAIATISKPEILLIDEVLAVGDLNFQKKCYEYLLKLRNEGCSMLLVSHAVTAVWAIANKGLFLHNGKQIYNGNAEEACRLYDEQNSRSALDSSKSIKESNIGESGSVTCTEASTLDSDLNKIEEIEFRQPFYVEYTIEVNETIEQPVFRTTFDAVQYKFILMVDSYEQGTAIDTLHPGKYKVRKYFDNQSFRPGKYDINLAISRRNIGTHLFFWVKATSFIILAPREKFLYSCPQAVWHIDSSITIE